MTAPVLVEYGAVKDGDRWIPRVWVNGVVEDIPARPRFAMERTAIDEAQADCILVAEGYLGTGPLTIRARVEPATPPALGMESSIGELSAELKRLGVTDLGAGRNLPGNHWSARAALAGHGVVESGHLPTLGDALVALLEALRRVALVRAGGGL